MGKSRQKKNFQRKPGQGGGNGGWKRDEWQVSDEDSKKNEMFDEYYKAQGIVTEDEYPQMLESLRSDLPTTFRVTGSRAHAETINDQIKNNFLPHMQNVEWEGVKYDPPKQISWYPGLLAWQISAPKRVVRKSEPFKRFQRFLVGETEVGNLSRQEAVSMIPPLFMDVQPHHKCLDMCAAPGSKTAQIIEALNPHHTESSGMLIANDSDYKRTHMLVHQTGRMPTKGLVVTNLDASAIPSISLGKGETLRFDRILADVPCSGDGTMRKNLEIWKKWGANDGNSLHALQLRILDRGMKLLKPGGRLVYSTCSFNPLENEAVVAAALNAYPGQYHLVDGSATMPELKRRPGLTSWKVATQSPASATEGRKLVWHDSHESYMETINALPESERENKKPLPATAWPPVNATELNLERCMRLVPHDQDTGGFFVCVFEKALDAQTEAPAIEIPEVPTLEEVCVADESGAGSLKRGASPSGVADAEPETKRSKPETASAAAGPSKQKRFRRDPTFKEDPYSFVDSAHEEVQSIVDWFQLDKDFERGNLLVRNDQGAPLRTIYIANDTVKTIIQNNDFTRLRIVSAGVKSFVRQDSQSRGDVTCKWRIPGDGITEVVPHMNQNLIKEVTLAELRLMLTEFYPQIERFSEEQQKWMSVAPLGNYILRVAAGESDGGNLSIPLILPVWKAKTSISLLIDKKEKSVLSLRTFGEDLCPAHGGLPPKQVAEMAAAAETGDVVKQETAAAVDEEEALNG